MLAYVALGSNLGDRPAHLRDAVEALAELGPLRARSSVWESAAVDSPEGAGDFLNAVVALDTQLPPRALLTALLAIEQRLGRDRSSGPSSVRNAPRTLDLDLLLYAEAGSVIDEPGLRLPHPRLHQRAFVLAPLAEIAPALVHPVLHLRVAELLAALPVTTAPPRRLAAPL